MFARDGIAVVPRGVPQGPPPNPACNVLSRASMRTRTYTPSTCTVSIIFVAHYFSSIKTNSVIRVFVITFMIPGISRNDKLIIHIVSKDL